MAKLAFAVPPLPWRRHLFWTASAASRCCRTHPPWHPPNLPSLSFCRWL